MRNLLIVLLVAVSMAASGQSADKLYAQGKSLYDAGKYQEAVAKLVPAAEKGHKKAQYRLGLCYDKGRGVAENDELAFKWYAKSAQQNYAKAQYQLGRCYKNGEGTAKDRQKAFLYFSKAAQQEHGKAQLALGKCYMKGKGTAADMAKAKTWFSRAIRNEKDGKEILADLRADAARGDEDAKAILELTQKKR
jgi:TPR repeat protein